jgi:N-acetylglucosaminyldiphosphoundecaprenol N-acetyl-beta-D-mannosaminyltransferase
MQTRHNEQKEPMTYIQLFNIKIDVLDMDGSVARIFTWLDAEARDCHYVVTPNVDHVVKLSENASFKAAYDQASLVVADGKPVVLASKLLGKPLPGTVPGSDLVPALFSHAQTRHNNELRVYLLGAGPGVAERASEKIHAQWPNVRVVGLYSPPMGFEKSPEECQKICAQINQTQADLLVIGLGAPKQELWVAKYQSELQVKAALCVGATIDFLAGEKPRAPMWMRRCGVEWLHRMASEPKRLVSRYLNDAVVFPRLFLKEWLKKD